MALNINDCMFERSVDVYDYLIFMFDPEVDADVEADDDKDEDDVAHEPDVDLLEVARLRKVLLDGSQ